MRGKSKNSFEIAEEKEIIELAIEPAKMNDKNKNLTRINLQKEINNHIKGDELIDVNEDGENLIVFFAKSNRYYQVDSNGVIQIDIIVDKNPGNIKIGINGETLIGDETSPYEVWCIEDLVEWSQNYSNYKDSYIKLMKTLNFNSNFSYTDGKVLNCTSIEELKDLLTNTTKNGFTPIYSFSGNFNGQNYEINNLYINNNGKAALFANISNATIKNLKISGKIISQNDIAGGIVAGATENNVLINLENSCMVMGNKTGCGGIVGNIRGTGDEKIINCMNNGEIICNNGIAGGIVGYTYAPSTGTLINANIYNSCNKGTIKSTNNGIAGGIAGCLNGDNQGHTNCNIYNCFNIGEIITSNTYCGGIYGQFRSMVAAKLEIKNSFILKDLNIKVGQSGWNNLVNGSNISSDYSSASMIEKTYMQSTNFTNELNNYIIQNMDEVDTTEWTKWIQDIDGYPTLDF